MSKTVWVRWWEASPARGRRAVDGEEGKVEGRRDVVLISKAAVQITVKLKKKKKKKMSRYRLLCRHRREAAADQQLREWRIYRLRRLLLLRRNAVVIWR
jgi:hypothetical protein